MRETPGAFRPDQYSNPANPRGARAHDRARDLAPDRRAASRTSSPASAPAARSPASRRYLKAQNPDVQIIGADPAGSVYSGGTGRPYLVEGVGEDFWPDDVRPVARRPRRRGERRRLVPHGSPRHARGGHPHRRVGRHRGARRARGRARPRARRRRRRARCPTPAAATCRRSSTTSGCSTWASCACDGHRRRRRARGQGRRDCPASCSSLPTSRVARRDRASCASTGVSQLVVSVTKELPLAAKEVVGTVRELRADGPGVPRPDRARPAGRRRSWSRALPMIGIGEPVARVVELLDTARRCSCSTAAIRSASLTRSDVLTFLAASTPSTRERRRRGWRRLRDARDPRRAGARPDDGAVVPPISLATTFAQDAVGEHGATSTRAAATRHATALEACLASLEGARHGLAFASGMAAEDAVLRTLVARRPRRHPDRRVRRDVPAGRARCTSASARVVGGRPRRPRRASPRRGTTSTAMVWIETPTNPRSSIVDIAAVARARARARRACRRRQHVRDAVPPAAARARRRRRRALEHEVPRRALRRRRRVRRSTTTPSSPSELALPAERDGRGAGAVRLLSRAARREDARRAHGPALRERAGGRRACSWATPRSTACCTPGSPTTRATTSPRAQMRDFGGMVSFTLRAARTPRSTSWPATRLFTLAESLGARRVAHRAPGAHDARVGRRARRSRSTPRSCGCRSASRPPTTSSPTSRQALDSL